MFLNFLWLDWVSSNREDPQWLPLDRTERRKLKCARRSFCQQQRISHFLLEPVTNEYANRPKRGRNWQHFRHFNPQLISSSSSSSSSSWPICSWTWLFWEKLGRGPPHCTALLLHPSPISVERKKTSNGQLYVCVCWFNHLMLLLWERERAKGKECANYDGANRAMTSRAVRTRRPPPLADVDQRTYVRKRLVIDPLLLNIENDLLSRETRHLPGYHDECICKEKGSLQHLFFTYILFKAHAKRN